MPDAIGPTVMEARQSVPWGGIHDWGEKGPHVNVDGVHIGVNLGPNGALVYGPLTAQDKTQKNYNEVMDRMGKNLNSPKGRAKARDQIAGRIGTLRSGPEKDQKMAPTMQEIVDRLDNGAPITRTDETLDGKGRDGKGRDGKDTDR